MKSIKQLIFFALLSREALAMTNELARVQHYLNSITTLESEFKQESSAATRFGKLYIAKPYKVKWDYILPKPSLIISSKNQFIYYDPKMKEVTYLPSTRVPGFFLANEKIEFNGNIKVLSYKKSASTMTVDLQDESMKKANLVVQLILHPNPIELTGIKVVDLTQQSEIIITFDHLKINQPISQEVFAFKDPNFFNTK